MLPKVLGTTVANLDPMSITSKVLLQSCVIFGRAAADITHADLCYSLFKGKEVVIGSVHGRQQSVTC